MLICSCFSDSDSGNKSADLPSAGREFIEASSRIPVCNVRPRQRQFKIRHQLRCLQPYSNVGDKIAFVLLAAFFLSFHYQYGRAGGGGESTFSAPGASSPRSFPTRSWSHVLNVPGLSRRSSQHPLFVVGLRASWFLKWVADVVAQSDLNLATESCYIDTVADMPISAAERHLNLADITVFGV